MIPYLVRSRKLANVFFCISALFFVVALIILTEGQVLEQALKFSNGNYISGAIFFAIFFILSVVLLLLAITLRCLEKDATEDINSVSNNRDM